MKKQAGFTLLEILIVLALIGIAAGLGLATSLDFYKFYNFQSQKDLVLEILFKARSQAVNNIHQTYHGVNFTQNKYTLFEGQNYLLRDQVQDIDFASSPDLVITGVNEVVFGPLSATTVPVSIALKDNENNFVYLDINYEGGIIER